MTSISFESKRAMATAALFTDIFQKYLDRNKCEHITNQDELDQFSSEILDHVIILGGFCRDILLNRPINDIDIVINLRELCKLQTNHLKQYHSKKERQEHSSRCVYWQRYLQRFSKGNINEEQSTEREMVMMHNINYVFNSDFWISILRSDELLDNKLSVKNMPQHGFVSAQIVNTVKYGNVNLDQQSIDLIDTFQIDQCYADSFVGDYAKFKTFHRKSRQLSMSGIDISTNANTQTAETTTPGGPGDDQKANKSRPETETSSHAHSHEHAHENHAHNPESEAAENASDKKKGRLNSMAVIEFDIDELGSDFGAFGFKKGGAAQNLSRPEYISIDIPIYSGKVRYKLLNYDFSINTAILPLSNIIKLKDHNNMYGGSESVELDAGPMTWMETIENGLGECDAIQDTTVNRILRCPERNHDACTLEAHPITFVFWRVIRWMIREPEFKLDRSLVVAQVKDYEKWLNQEWFDSERNCARFMEYMVSTLEAECKSERDVRQMLSVMNMLQFNGLFIKVLNETQSARHALQDAIGSVQNESISNNAITDAFKEYAYPVEQQLFKIASPTEEELEKYKQKKEFLEAQVQTKNQRIEDLEKQNDRLLKEVRYLQQLNEQSDRSQDLEGQNSRLLSELQLVNDSKIALAINANKTIDELRKYLVEYQELVMGLSNR